MDNIQNLGKAASMFAEYDTMRSDGLLLRVTGAASPTSHGRTSAFMAM